MPRFSLPIPRLLLFVLLTVAAVGADIRVASLNCYLLFDPRIDHRGKVDDEQRMTLTQYETKLGNLASLMKGYQVVGLQETGGRGEISALAARAGLSWLWTQGNDTATGEEVGLLFKLPGWKVTSRGRVTELDRLVSKHLWVEASQGTNRVYFLVVHLIRPIGTQAPKHQAQLAGIGAWMRQITASEPGCTVVVLGDTNNALTENGSSPYGFGSEAGEQIGFSATHLTNKAFDRLVVAGPGIWRQAEVRKPPYGKRPAAPLKREWTDHYLLGAVLRLP